MSLCEWYAKRVVLLTGVTSELGRALLEKILRCLPDVRVYVVLRSQNDLNGEERLKKIFASPGYERLRQEMPSAISRVKTFEGNLLYENLALSIEDKVSLREVTVAFHAAGPHDYFLEYCQELPKLRSVAIASSIFKHRGRITECLQNEKIPNLPIALVRFPCIGPAYKEPMPGFVESLKGPTALMIGAGFAYGNSKLPAEIIPIDIAVNTMIAAAWEVGMYNENVDAHIKLRKKPYKFPLMISLVKLCFLSALRRLNVLFFSCFLSFSRRTNVTKPVVYNAPQLGCTWNDLIKKSRRASSKFPYPTFGIRGMTSIEPLYWILVIFLEWLPSLICDIVFGLCGRKQRILAEYDRVRNALQPLKSISSRSWPVERNHVYLLKERLMKEERDVFPIIEEIDIESYVLCVAAATRKYCVNEDTLNIIKIIYLFFLYIPVILIVTYIASHTSLLHA
ncbi:Fatty acyl-CoA reductase 2 [Atta colombica]|uniref:Fatty acyl-CoA reductase n=1 Tax=Atta colombica TaxID=520822 RepID=A0A195AZP7_9HYME|nr:Fatty acyl-CoA reductase 2 [Atta colombica]